MLPPGRRGLAFDHASQVFKFQQVVLLALTAVAIAHLPSATASGKGKSLRVRVGSGRVVGSAGGQNLNMNAAADRDTASGFAGLAQTGDSVAAGIGNLKPRPFKFCGTSDLSPSQQANAEAEAARRVARHVNMTGSRAIEGECNRDQT